MPNSEKSMTANPWMASRDTTATTHMNNTRRLLVFTRTPQRNISAISATLWAMGRQCNLVTTRAVWLALFVSFDPSGTDLEFVRLRGRRCPLAKNSD